MIPYAFNLAAVAGVGAILGKNQPEVAKKYSFMVFCISFLFALLISTVLITIPKSIIKIYDDSPSVEAVCLPAFHIFALAFLFDWT